MKEFDKIYVSWRKGQGSARHIIGLLQKSTEGIYTFNYEKKAVENAKKDGFTAYIEFPNLLETYNGTVLDIFAQRLIKPERPDIQSFYNFWEIEPQFKADKFYILGHTQGLLPTDNFEFLADYNIVPGIHFLTELAGLSAKELSPTSLQIGDELTFKLDPTNQFDPEAVLIYKGDLEIGYIKKIHCKVFHKPGAENLKIFAKAIEKNGKIKKVFVKVTE